MDNQITQNGQIIIANRSSGNISILDENTGELLRTVDLPSEEGESTPEPMYVYHLLSTNEIVVDDRANNRVIFFNQETLEVTGTVATGAGNFHMWASPQEDQLWVANDIDNTLTVIDPQTKTEITRVALPDELIGTDSKPHDVIIDPAGQYAYATIIRTDDFPTDLLVKINAQTFEILDTAEVGKDPHVSLAPENNLLYIAAQNSNRIDVFDRRGTELVQVDAIEQTGSHGIEYSFDGRYIYTTNLPGGGTNGLFVTDTVTNETVSNVDTPFPVPHNVWLNGAGDRIFVTHSGGTSSQVSFYSLEDPTNPVLVSTTNVNGFNPFGLGYAAPIQDDLLIGNDGQDMLRGKEGNDKIYGQGGNDLLRGNQGNDKLFGQEGNDKLFGGSGNDVLVGGEGNDSLQGKPGNDLLIGVNVDSFTPGANEIDFMRGDEGRDTFVLGDNLEVYYDDGNANTVGFSDLAFIEDFQAEDSDVIRLHGSADDYILESFGINTVILYQEENKAPELIGVVEGVTNLDINSGAFEFATI